MLTIEPIPALTPTSLPIRVHAVPLNFRDANIIYNMHPWPVLSTGIPCSDCVITIGENVTGFVLGNRVSPRSPGLEQNKEWLGGAVRRWEGGWSSGDPRGL
jgi:NADPH:quinone reductase-like Zn-dependent oxidoreductase